MSNFEKYLNELERELYFFDNDEINQILDEYRELYSAKLEAGINELDAIKSFDQPKVVAQNYATELGYSTNKLSKEIVNMNKKIKTFIASTNEKASSTFNSVKRESKTVEEQIDTSELNESIDPLVQKKTRKKGSTFVTYFIIYPLFYIYYFIIFVINFAIKFFAISTWLITVFIFILSFLFIDLEIYTKALRSLEIIVFLCISICCFILMFVKVGKHE